MDALVLICLLNLSRLLFLVSDVKGKVSKWRKFNLEAPRLNERLDF